jgi:hypothetical protein
MIVVFCGFKISGGIDASEEKKYRKSDGKKLQKNPTF